MLIGKQKIVLENGQTKTAEELFNIFEDLRQKQAEDMSKVLRGIKFDAVPFNLDLRIRSFDIGACIEKPDVIRDTRKLGLKDCYKFYVPKGKKSIGITVSQDAEVLCEDYMYRKIEKGLKLVGGIKVKKVDVLGAIDCYLVNAKVYKNLKIDGVYVRVA